MNFKADSTSSLSFKIVPTLHNSLLTKLYEEMADKNNFVTIEKKVLPGMSQEGISGPVEAHLDPDTTKKALYDWGCGGS